VRVRVVLVVPLMQGPKNVSSGIVSSECLSRVRGIDFRIFLREGFWSTAHSFRFITRVMCII
jgi:hypothetical protein